MLYLQRSQIRPNPDVLSPADSKFIQEHFNVYGGNLTVQGQPVEWSAIEAIEVVVAPHISGAAVGLWITNSTSVAGALACPFSRKAVAVSECKPIPFATQ